MSRPTRLLLLLLAARLLLSLAYSALIPLGEAPDEADHYAYAAYIATEHRLPEGPAMTQAKHPPLYHFLAAAVAAPVVALDFSFLRSNPDVTVVPGVPGTAPNFFIHTRLEDWPWAGGPLAMHLGRLISVAAGLLLTLSTCGLGRRLWPERPALALAAAAFVAFLPESLFVGSAMSNDTLAAALGTAGLWAALTAAAQVRRPLLLAAGAGLLLGLAFLTKVSTAALWPIAALALWLDRREGAEEWRSRGAEEQRTQFGGTAYGQPGSALVSPATSTLEAPASSPAPSETHGPGVAEELRNLPRGAKGLLAPVLMLVIAGLVATPWLWRNWQLYGDPTGTALALATVDRRQASLGLADLVWLLRGWFFSFWGKFGGAGHIALPGPFYLLWALLILAAVAGWIRWLLLARNKSEGLASATRPAAHVVLWGAPALVALSILSYTRIALGTDQGRLLFPALAPLALALAGGLSAWLPPGRQDWLPLGAAGVMGALALAALYLGILIPFGPPDPPSAVDLARALPVAQMLGDRLEVVSLRWMPAEDGQRPARLVIYWRARDGLDADLRAVLRLVGQDGTVLQESKRSPGAGRLSTDRWPTGRLVADEYAVAPGVEAQVAHAELAVQPFPQGPWLPLTQPAQPGPWLSLPLP